MTRGEVLLLPLARSDLREIWRYIARENSAFVADIVVTRLRATMDVLAEAPMIGRVRREYPGRPRSFAVRPHIIFYQPLSGRSGIEVWRVLHGARDLREIMAKRGDGEK